MADWHQAEARRAQSDAAQGKLPAPNATSPYTDAYKAASKQS